MEVLGYFLLDFDCLSYAEELLKSSLAINISHMDENNPKLSKSYMVLSQLNIKNYNIKDAITNYEKYINCAKKIFPEKTAEEEVKNLEIVLTGLKNIAEDLKKKGGKGKDGLKKLFDELLSKHVGKYSEPLFSKKQPTSNSKSIDSDMLLFDYMIKNNFIKSNLTTREPESFLNNLTEDSKIESKEIKKNETSTEGTTISNTPNKNISGKKSNQKNNSDY